MLKAVIRQTGNIQDKLGQNAATAELILIEALKVCVEQIRKPTRNSCIVK